jgi:hypothetical protein
MIEVEIHRTGSNIKLRPGVRSILNRIDAYLTLMRDWPTTNPPKHLTLTNYELADLADALRGGLVVFPHNSRKQPAPMVPFCCLFVRGELQLAYRGYPLFSVSQVCDRAARAA